MATGTIPVIPFPLFRIVAFTAANAPFTKTSIYIIMHTISSKLTFFYKYILIFIWLTGFGIGTREVIFIQPRFDAQWIQYIVSWAVVAFFIFLATGSIKMVSLNRQKKQLEVSNFMKTITIDFSEIEDIDGSSLLSPKLVWFILKEKSVFGRKISFMPTNRPARGIGKHPLVMELRKEFKLDHSAPAG